MSKKINAVNSLLKLTMFIVFLALALILPTVTGIGNPRLGEIFLPMHLPVMVSGIVCGTPWGIIVGLVSPILKYVLTETPELSVAVPMAFELATYGGMCGMLYKTFPKKIGFVYPTLIISMVMGRVVNGSVCYLISTTSDTEFVLEKFITITTIDALPGIVIQLALIPLIVLALNKTRLMFNK